MDFPHYMILKNNNKKVVLSHGTTARWELLVKKACT